LFITIVALFSLMLIWNFGLYGVDDILLVVQPSPSAEYERWALIDGRYLLFIVVRTASLIGLDIMRDYAIFALIYALSFATFVVAVVDYLIRDIEVSRAERAIIGLLFAILLMTHGFQVDVIVWKNCFPFMLLIYFIMTIALGILKSKRRRLWHYPELAALFLALNFVYQPATMALFWLALAWAVLTYTGAQEADARKHLRLIGHVAAVAALVVVAGLGFIALTRVTGVGGDRVFNLAHGPVLLGNLKHHVKYVIGLVDPSGTICGPYAGGPIVFLAAILLVIIFRAALGRSWVQSLFVSALLGAILICSQNLENILLGDYVPNGRNSFYTGLLFPLLWLAAWLAVRPRMVRMLLLIAAVATALQTMIFAKIVAERSELQRRDFGLAKDIGDAIRNDPSLAGVTGISLPIFQVPAGYYRALSRPFFDSGRSILEYAFAQVPLITFVTGVELERIGLASCRPSEKPGPLRIRRDGTNIVVCF
jgi:hypothetical protein